MLEISNNSTSIFRSCPKKYYFKYILGYDPYKKSTALTTGSIIHNAYDMLYKGFSEDEITKYIAEICNEEIAKSPPEEAEDLLIMKYTLLGMWLNFPKDLSVFSEIKPELELSLDFANGVRLVLRVDGLVTKDKKLWIRELKTTGLSFSQFENRCRTSPQASLYTYALRRLGHNVEGVIYDYIKKPQLRKNLSENADQFGARIMNSYKEKPDYYFKRYFAYRNNEELLLFEEDLMATARNIERCCREDDWYRNQDACWTFNSPCPYMPICFQKKPDQLTIEVFFVQTTIKPEKGGNHGGGDEEAA